MFQGSMTALITPFKDNKVDEDAFRSFVDWQIEEGTEAVIPCGTTGESPTLDHQEHMRVTEICIDAADGRVPGYDSAQGDIPVRRQGRGPRHPKLASLSR